MRIQWYYRNSLQAEMAGSAGRDAKRTCEDWRRAAEGAVGGGFSNICIEISHLYRNSTDLAPPRKGAASVYRKCRFLIGLFKISLDSRFLMVLPFRLISTGGVPSFPSLSVCHEACIEFGPATQTLPAENRDRRLNIR
jgi:hypothetical protein